MVRFLKLFRGAVFILTLCLSFQALAAVSEEEGTVFSSGWRHIVSNFFTTLYDFNHQLITEHTDELPNEETLLDPPVQLSFPQKTTSPSKKPSIVAQPKFLTQAIVKFAQKFVQLAQTYFVATPVLMSGGMLLRAEATYEVVPISAQIVCGVSELCPLPVEITSTLTSGNFRTYIGYADFPGNLEACYKNPDGSCTKLSDINPNLVAQTLTYSTLSEFEDEWTKINVHNNVAANGTLATAFNYGTGYVDVNFELIFTNSSTPTPCPQVAIPPTVLQVFQTNNIQKSSFPFVNFTAPGLASEDPVTLEYALAGLEGQAELAFNNTGNYTVSYHQNNTRLSINTLFSALEDISSYISILYHQTITHLPVFASITHQGNTNTVSSNSSSVIPVNWAPRVNTTTPLPQAISWTNEPVNLSHQLFDPNTNQTLFYRASIGNGTEFMALSNHTRVVQTPQFEASIDPITGLVAFTPFHKDIREYFLTTVATDPYGRQTEQSQHFRAGDVLLEINPLPTNFTVNHESGNYTFTGIADTPDNLTDFNLELTLSHNQVWPTVLSNATFLTTQNDNSTYQITVPQQSIPAFLEGFTVHWPAVTIADPMHYTFRLFRNAREKLISFTQYFQIPACQAVADTYQLLESTPSITGNVLTNDINPLNKTLRVLSINGNSVNQPILGQYSSLRMQENGDFIFTLDTRHDDIRALQIGQSLTLPFIYKIEDALNNTSEAALKFKIEGENNPPLILSASNRIHLWAGETALLSFGTYDVDDARDTLSVEFFDYTNSHFSLGKLTPQSGFTWLQDQQRLQVNQTLPKAFYRILARVKDPHGAADGTLFYINIKEKPPIDVQPSTSGTFQFEDLAFETTAKNITIGLKLDPTINKIRLPNDIPETLSVAYDKESGKLEVTGPKDDVISWVKQLNFSNGQSSGASTTGDENVAETEMEIMIDDGVNPPYTKTITILVPKNHPPVQVKPFPMLNTTVNVPYIFSPLDYFKDPDNDTLLIAYAAAYSAQLADLKWNTNNISITMPNPETKDFYFFLSDGVWSERKNFSIQAMPLPVEAGFSLPYILLLAGGIGGAYIACSSCCVISFCCVLGINSFCCDIPSFALNTMKKIQPRNQVWSSTAGDEEEVTFEPKIVPAPDFITPVSNFSAGDEEKGNFYLVAPGQDFSIPVSNFSAGDDEEVTFGSIEPDQDLTIPVSEKKNEV